MTEFHNLHKGETCIIIGNGPSLKDVPKHFLWKHTTFGANTIFKMKGFTPDYYVCINPLKVLQNLPQINDIDCTAKFIREEFAADVTGSYPLNSSNIARFSKKPLDYLYEGYTVTFCSLQLAYYMGFSRVLLVGVDHYYETEDKTPNKLMKATGKDLENHFHPGYMNDGDEWHLPDLPRSEKAYELARRTFAKAGRTITNLTAGTKLEVFQKGDLCDYA